MTFYVQQKWANMEGYKEDKRETFYRGAIILIIVNNHNVKTNAKLKKS